MASGRCVEGLLAFFSPATLLIDGSLARGLRSADAAFYTYSFSLMRYRQLCSRLDTQLNTLTIYCSSSVSVLAVIEPRDLMPNNFDTVVV